MGEMRGVGWFRQGFEGGAQGGQWGWLCISLGGSGALPSLASQQSYSALIYFI